MWSKITLSIMCPLEAEKTCQDMISIGLGPHSWWKGRSPCFNHTIRSIPSKKISPSKTTWSSSNAWPISPGCSGKLSRPIVARTISTILSFTPEKIWRGSQLMTIFPISRTERKLCSWATLSSYGQCFCRRLLPKIIEDIFPLLIFRPKLCYKNWLVSQHSKGIYRCWILVKLLTFCIKFPSEISCAACKARRGASSVRNKIPYVASTFLTSMKKMDKNWFW